MNNMQAVAMPQVIFGDVSVCSEEYHSDYFIAAPSCDYDSQNRLIRYDDSALGVTYVYTYDNRGNILNYRYMDYVPKDTAVSETGGDTYTFSYTNNVFKDAVTAINGESITYDSSYNPLKWTNGRTLTWVQGRRLESVTGSAGTVSYVYDENGIRTAKTGAVNTQYYVVDGTYLGERTVIDGTEYLITYMYGDSGVVGIEVNGVRYFFVKNVQGDIIGIIDSTGAVVANYAYDAYGYCYSVTDASGNEITSASHVANLNPFRYRSYMYDTETGFYYLTTRYYDPDVGRFLNVDSYVSTGQGLDGHNMFAYCNNNPIMMTDTTGDLPFFAITAIAGAVIGAVVGGVRAAKSGKSVLKGALVGAAVGGLVGAGLGAVASAALTGSVVATTTQVVVGAGQLATAAVTGGVSGGVAYVANNLQQAGTQISDTVSGVSQQTVSTVKKFVSHTPKNPGEPFKPGVTGFQFGVDPNTLTPKKDLTTLDPKRLADAVKFAGDHAIIVGKTGIIHDGHHRVADAIMNGRAVDIFVEPYK